MKSTFSYQLVASFLDNNPDSVAVYLDIENAGNADNNAAFNSRVDSFGIDRSRFMYKSVVANLEQVFAIIEGFINLKRQMKEKTGSELQLLVVWDIDMSSCIVNCK